jgi:hypothetical protein
MVFFNHICKITKQKKDNVSFKARKESGKRDLHLIKILNGAISYIWCMYNFFFFFFFYMSAQEGGGEIRTSDYCFIKHSRS